MALETVFNSFCTFGCGDEAGKPLMDLNKCQKVFRDLKLYGKTLTSTDIDIAFNRPEVKPKNSRKISFTQFEKLLQIVAPKYQGGDETAALEALREKIILTKGQETSHEGTENQSVTSDRLVNTSKYGSGRKPEDESGEQMLVTGRDYQGYGYVGSYFGKQ